MDEEICHYSPPSPSATISSNVDYISAAEAHCSKEILTHHDHLCNYYRWDVCHRQGLLTEDTIKTTVRESYGRLRKGGASTNQLEECLQKAFSAEGIISVYLNNEKEIYESFKQTMMGMCSCTCPTPNSNATSPGQATDDSNSANDNRRRSEGGAPSGFLISNKEMNMTTQEGGGDMKERFPPNSEDTPHENQEIRQLKELSKENQLEMLEQIGLDLSEDDSDD